MPVSYPLLNLDAEMRLANKLVSLKCPDRFKGSTTVDDRKSHHRMDILNNRLEGVVFTVKDGKQVTLRQAFRSAYGEDLE